MQAPDGSPASWHTYIGCASPLRKRGGFRRCVCVLLFPNRPHAGIVPANPPRDAEYLLADVTVLHVAFAGQK
ncbi:hypothetical protein VULLAG_LOCUS67 [Vulpes lagopus]